MGFFSSFKNLGEDIFNPIKGIQDITGVTQQADSAQTAADLQYQIAQKSIQSQNDSLEKQLDFARQSRDQQAAARNQALALAQPSAQELGQMHINLELQNTAISQQMSALQRNQDLLDSADPAIKEAGNQALQLLQGKQAASVQPVLDQRNRQRSQLEQTLKDRLGPDYAQSSAGAAALRNFDNDTSSMSNQIQQQTLGQLLGVAQNTSNTLNPVSQNANAYASLGALNVTGLQAAQNSINTQVNAFSGNPVTQQLQYQAPNYAPLISAAGNSTIGGVLQGQATQGIFNTAASVGGNLLAAHTLAAAAT